MINIPSELFEIESDENIIIHRYIPYIETVLYGWPYVETPTMIDMNDKIPNNCVMNLEQLLVNG